MKLHNNLSTFRFILILSVILCPKPTGGNACAGIVFEQAPFLPNGAGFTSDSQSPALNFRADNFSLAQDAVVYQVMWYGFYQDFSTVLAPTDNFTVQFRNDNATLPGAVFFTATPTVSRVLEVGNIFRYTASLPNVALTSGTPYHLSIFNNTNASQYWRWVRATGPGAHFFSNDLNTWTQSSTLANLSFQLTAVPEPSVWLLGAASLAMTGLVARRRRGIGDSPRNHTEETRQNSIE